MTPRQAALLRFIDQYQRRHGGVSPTFLEMAAGVGLHSKSGIHRMIEGLEAQGYIRRQHKTKRAIDIIRMPRWNGAALAQAITDLIDDMIVAGHPPKVLVLSSDNWLALARHAPLLVEQRRTKRPATYNGLAIVTNQWIRDWEILP